MRTPNGYRFGLQFSLQSDAHRQAGEFLESLGNKKSEAVVIALIEYLQAHPEALNKDNPVKIVAAFGYSEETLNAKIEALIRKVTNGKEMHLPTDMHPVSRELQSGKSNALDVLLNGLEQFE